MSIVVNLPPELETKLAAEASRHGVPLTDYLVRILSNGRQTGNGVQNGAELVAYWKQAGVLGTRADVSDSQQHARDVRTEAESRRHT
jgi:hypothetical protein